MLKVEWTKDAVEDLQDLDKPIAKRILNKISWLLHHFDNITPEHLSGELVGTYKIRVGDWRVVYTIELDVIVIQAVGHRKEIYK
ncbi:type II toxin-antitoxin system RelE/ParE family toxin [Desulfobacterota bacterium AH_259_B03_O07]|nr:type II toxin-antitoxin system RelE/ParE family toxin [Desulfobacterota bacterium AH_259_B03_O07]